MIPDFDLSHVGVAALTGGVYYLSRTLYVAVNQRRWQNGHDRRRSDEGSRITMADLRKDIHDARDEMNGVMVRFGERLVRVETEVANLKERG